jgi:2-dehydro-3-deoxyphosphogluconate aldolase/(4S)-4-hydroxy-2-oxoglutarate aldolase
MNAQTVRALIEDLGIVPSVRVGSVDDARFAAEAVADAGIRVIEITMTIPHALSVVEGLATARPDLAIGAGTVLDAPTARSCIDAGASFVTSPGVERSVIAFAIAQAVLVFPGVLTPTDIITASHAGADLLKIFPCAPWDGVAYLQSMLGPFPHARFIASGGITQQSAGAYIRAGAIAVGVGAELIPRRAVLERDRRWITELAHRFVATIREARSSKNSRDELVDRR